MSKEIVYLITNMKLSESVLLLKEDHPQAEQVPLRESYVVMYFHFLNFLKLIVKDFLKK